MAILVFLRNFRLSLKLTVSTYLEPKIKNTLF